MLRTPGFPAAIGGRYRLDSLHRWEDAQLALAAALAAAPAPRPVTVAGDEAPAQLPPRRTRRVA